MEAVVLVIHLMLALAIIALVLLQQSEGGGLGIGGGSGGGMGGLATARTTANLLTRLTTVFAIIFMITSLTLAILAKKQVSDRPAGILELANEPAVTDVQDETTVEDVKPEALPVAPPVPDAEPSIPISE